MPDVTTRQGFVDSITDCMGPTFTFPAITLPGFPSYLAGLFDSMMAGINHLLPFLPPDEFNLPSLPDPQIYIDGFKLNTSIPVVVPEIPAFGGLPTIPSFGPINWAFPAITLPDLSSIINMLLTFALMPFELIKAIIEEIINSLTVVIPDLATITALITGFLTGFSIPAITITLMAGCIAQTLLDIMTALIPV